jgi:hypothetical protein
MVLPLPDSPTSATISPGGHVEAQVIDRQRAIGADLDAQITDAKQRRDGIH